MKTTPFNVLKNSGLLLFIFFMVVVVSCNKDDESTFTSEDNQSLNYDAVSESSQEEVEDIATSLLNTTDPISGRVEEDSRFSSAYILKVMNLDRSTGTISINFDKRNETQVNPNGSVDSKGNIRKGSISITWSGNRWYSTGAFIVITLNNYSINGVVVSGERRIVNISTPGTATVIWTISGTLTTTWPDKSTATRKVNIMKTWTRNNKGAFEKVIISQTPGTLDAFSGTNRLGKTYSVKITKPFEYDLTCLLTNKYYVPAIGVKEVTVDKKIYTVDYGTGTCDNTYTVTLNGKSKQFTAKTDSSSD